MSGIADIDRILFCSKFLPEFSLLYQLQLSCNGVICTGQRFDANPMKIVDWRKGVDGACSESYLFGTSLPRSVECVEDEVLDRSPWGSWEIKGPFDLETMLSRQPGKDNQGLNSFIFVVCIIITPVLHISPRFQISEMDLPALTMCMPVSYTIVTLLADTIRHGFTRRQVN